MIRVLSTNITSPLGYDTEQNYQAVKAGKSALCPYMGWKGIPEEFTASLFSEKQMAELQVEGYTRFESIVIRSISDSVRQTDIDVSSPRTLFVLSTTKGDIEELSDIPENDGRYFSPGASAKRIAGYFGMTTDPIVVCNACISGTTAQILASRLMETGLYDNAIVCGADCQSPFVVAGFMSFKSLSPEECRPFDIERLGLNLGDAAATVILSNSDGKAEGWKLLKGTLDNDAYHLSAPSPSGEGTYGVIMKTLEGFDKDRLALVSVHGTATMFNDQMESKAVERAGLSDIPACALKGYYGHTLGAAGILESIMTMRALDDGLILPTRGFSEIGVSGKISITDRELQTDRTSFLKIISGFGGCNGALLYSKEETHDYESCGPVEHKTLHCVRIRPDSIEVDGEKLETETSGKQILTEAYRKYGIDYPKFYKMDVFSRIVFLAAELIAMKEPIGDEDTAVIIFNRSSSIVADRKHIATYSKPEEFYPSPSVFLYTLPNISIGEVAIRHGFKGETSLYILNERNDELISAVINAAFACSDAETIMTGWADCTDEDTFEAEIILTTK